MAAPKGNKFAIGCTTSGFPPFYDKPEKMQAKIDEYFESLREKKRFVKEMDGSDYLLPNTPIFIGDIYKGSIVWDKVEEGATITGLTRYLGFSHRSSLLDYQKKDEFSNIIKTAKLRVEESYERLLRERNPTGAIFALKQFGWNDKQEIDHTSMGEKINIPPINWVKGDNE